MTRGEDAQLRWIESIHRGFLYQHLYAVACILLARTLPDVTKVLVEQDEDVEIILTGEHRYIQIKTRGQSLQLSDISRTLDRFVDIQKRHLDGSTRPVFFVVCNQEVSKSAQNDDRFRALQVQVVSPGQATVESHMPPAWESLETALEWCELQAELIPQSRLEPKTLVWKLATEVALASTGQRPDGHTFWAQDLAELFELLYVRSQRLPLSNRTYRPFESEPQVSESTGVQLVVALSGGGKTTWLTEHALHVGHLVVYFDVADNSDDTVAPSLVREIAGALVEIGQGEKIRQALYAGATGLTSLKAIDLVLQNTGTPMTIAVDNCHRLGAPRMTEVVGSIKAARWVLLAQPSPQTIELSSRLQCPESHLGGLTVDGIAAEFKDAGTPVTIVQANRVKALTGGLPLFVRDAAKLCQERFDGDPDLLCRTFEDAVASHTVGQEVLLRSTIERLGSEAARAAGALLYCTVRLTESEAIGFVVAALAVGEQSASRCIRELTAWGIAQVFTNRDIEIHDAFRGVIADMAALDQAAVRHVRTVLGALLKKSISFKRPERLLAYARIAPLIGEARVVADIASRMPEHFHEHGMDVALQRVLSDMASDASLSTDEQFEVTDTLTFWNIQRGVDAKLVQQQIATLERLLQSVINKRWAHQAIAIKRLHTVTTLADARRVYADNIPHFFDEPHPWLILRYTYAVALLSLGDLEAADLVSKTVVMGYLNFVGLRPDELFARNAPEIRASLGQRANDIEDLKHVADAIELRSRVVGAKGGAVALLKIWAFKIYALANAPSSAVKVGKDFIDALVSIGEISEARSFMEKTLLPGIAEFGLVEELVPLRAQHAVVIAYAGDTGLAIKEIRELAVFKSTSPLLEAELTNQERLIHAIASGQYRLPIARERNLGRSGALVDSLQLRGGRNEPCMCGSGVKQKRCCGR